MINQKVRGYLLSITVIVSCLLAYFSTMANKQNNYADFYPFFNWRLIPFPSYYNAKIYYRLYYQNEKNWQRLSVNDKDYLTTLMINLKRLQEKKITQEDFKKRLMGFIPIKAKRFKVVKESYLPLRFIQNQHEYKREDILLFERRAILGSETKSKYTSAALS